MKNMDRESRKNVVEKCYVMQRKNTKKYITCILPYPETEKLANIIGVFLYSIINQASCK